MEFIVNKKPIKKVDKRKGFLLVVETMGGDADSTDYVEVGVFPDTEKGREYLEEVITVCDDAKKAYPSGMAGYDDYSHIKNFDKWFMDGATEDEYEEIEPYITYEDGDSIMWPFYCETCNSCEGYELFWLENGERFKVKIKR
jgi:hypothetical protein